jgi:flagellar biosynthesis activator protein FlaF
MHASALAQTAYGPKAVSTQSPRETEYQTFVRITGALATAHANGRVVEIAKALHDNNRLWTTLAADAASDGNQLPVSLRARIVNLAQFSLTHSMKVLRMEADAQPLIEINQTVMKGLRGQAGV